MAAAKKLRDPKGSATNGAPVTKLYEAEPDLPIASNHKAEVAICHLLLCSDEASASSILGTLQARDFWHDNTRWIFSECVLMRKEGVPLNDPAAQTAWFKTGRCLERFHAAGLNPPHSAKAGFTPHLMVLELVVEGTWASAAHIDYYVAELCKWRLTRGTRKACYDVLEFLNDHPEEPLEVYDALVTTVKLLEQLASRLQRKEPTT